MRQPAFIDLLDDEPPCFELVGWDMPGFKSCHTKKGTPKPKGRSMFQTKLLQAVLVLSLFLPLHAQIVTGGGANSGGGGGGGVQNVTSLPGSCSPNSSNNVVFLTTGTVGLYQCTSPNTWTAATGVGAGSNPTGAAGGGLTGTYPNPALAPLSTTAAGAAPVAPGDPTKYLNGANPPAWTVPPGGSGSPGGAANTVQYNAAGAFGGFVMSGDCTLVVATGAITCTPASTTTALALKAPLTGTGATGTWPIAISGLAATALALATLPTPCSAGNYPLGILANGNSTGCTPVTSPVVSVFTRTGAVVAASGDYTAAQVTNAVDKTGANTYTAGAKQGFQSSATTAGMTFGGVVSDPSVLAEGDTWYRTDLHVSRQFQNGVAVTLGSAGAGTWGGGGGAGGTPAGGVLNSIQYNASGNFGGFVMSGDCTLVVATGVITCAPASTTTALALKAPLTGVGATGTWPIAISGNAGTATAIAALPADATKYYNGAGAFTVPAGGASPLTTKGDLFGHSTVDARLPVGTDTQVLTADSTQPFGMKWAPGTGSSTANQNLREIPISFDGGGVALAGTTTRCTLIEYAATITGVYLISDVSGGATVDIRTVAYASYTGPASAASITASAIPALASAVKYSDTTLTGWSKSIAANTAVCAVLSSPTALTWIAGKILVTAN